MPPAPEAAADELAPEAAAEPPAAAAALGGAPADHAGPAADPVTAAAAQRGTLAERVFAVPVTAVSYVQDMLPQPCAKVRAAAFVTSKCHPWAA